MANVFKGCLINNSFPPPTSFSGTAFTISLFLATAQARHRKADYEQGDRRGKFLAFSTLEYKSDQGNNILLIKVLSDFTLLAGLHGSKRLTFGCSTRMHSVPQRYKLPSLVWEKMIIFQARLGEYPALTLMGYVRTSMERTWSTQSVLRDQALHAR